MKRTSGPHKSKGRNTGTKNKVVHHSDGTYTINLSTGRYTKVTDMHTVPSTVSLPPLDHLKANDTIQKAVCG